MNFNNLINNFVFFRLNKAFILSILAFFVLFSSVLAQTEVRRITGRVIDEHGEPMAGVTIISEDRQSVTITNTDGYYEINIAQGELINFSMVGFSTQSVRIGAPIVYDIVLVESLSEFDELVVTGFGHQRRISTISAQSSMKMGDLVAPTGSLSTVLAGRLAGVVAVQRSGEPGRDEADIWIRGITTPNNARPLVLVDGVERPFNFIDPNDVESFTILKDASATAVYGVRGANGVILITTKQGTIGKPVVNVDYYEGINMFTKVPKMANGVTFMEAANEATFNMGRTEPVYSADLISNTRSGTDPLLYPDVDWFGEIFNKTASTRRLNVNIRGGSQMAQFFSSISYFQEKGMNKSNPFEEYESQINFRRINITNNLNIQLTSTTRIDIGASGFLGMGHYPYQPVATIFAEAMNINPVMYPRMFEINGVEYVTGTQTAGSYRNPYADATKRGYRENANSRIQSNIRLRQDLDFLLQGLKLNMMFSFDANFDRERRYEKRESTWYWLDRNNPYDANGNPVIDMTWQATNPILRWEGRDFNGELRDYFEASLNWERVFGDHRIGAMAIYTQQNRTVNQANSLIDAAPYRMQGYAGRVTYSWKDKYFSEFNIGYNGSENFPIERRFGTFPSFGVGWVASNEDFWTALSDVVPFFKLRYTIGQVGNGNVGSRRFMYLEQYSSAAGWGTGFGTNATINGFTVANPATSLGWEVSTKQNLGIDLHMFNSDLSLTVDLFNETRTDILVDRVNSLPAYAGFQIAPFGNVGEVKNKGIDGNIEYFSRVTNDLGITFRGNLTWIKPEWVYDDLPLRDEAYRNRAGFSLTSVSGFTATGLYTQEDIAMINQWVANGSNPDARPLPAPPRGQLTDMRAGDIKYMDRNDDGVIDDSDRGWLGNGDVPEINYGFGINIDYKAFSVGFMFQGTARANRFVSGIVHPFSDDASANNLYSNITDRWSEENPSQDVFYPRLSFVPSHAGNQNNRENSTWWLKDMSFLRLKTLQVTYRLPRELTQRINVSNANIYLMGNNLFTFAKWDLWDPELNTASGNRYPNTTTYTLGINFSF